MSVMRTALFASASAAGDGRQCVSCWASSVVTSLLLVIGLVKGLVVRHPCRIRVSSVSYLSVSDVVSGADVVSEDVADVVSDCRTRAASVVSESWYDKLSPLLFSSARSYTTGLRFTGIFALRDWSPRRITPISSSRFNSRCTVRWDTRALLAIVAADCRASVPSSLHRSAIATRIRTWTGASTGASLRAHEIAFTLNSTSYFSAGRSIR